MPEVGRDGGRRARCRSEPQVMLVAAGSTFSTTTELNPLGLVTIRTHLSNRNILRKYSMLPFSGIGRRPRRSRAAVPGDALNVPERHS